MATPLVGGRIYIDGDRPGTLFCRRCLVTIVVAGPSHFYSENVEKTKKRHERQNPGRHGGSR